MLSRARSFASLLRWLGPWTKDTRSPPGVTRTTWTIREGRLSGHRAHVKGLVADADAVTRLDAYVYTPSRPVGLYVISPGLHFSGPDDPRLERFCRVLSNAGFVVVAPFLPSFVDLRVAPSAVTDLEVIVRAAHARHPELGRPAIFSISFGSWPALEVAARCPEHVDGVITFGGYASFESVVRFCLDGVMHLDGRAVPMAFDPLNMPALFLNVMRFMDIDDDPEPLAQALREMCYRTWGRMELKAEGRLVPFIDAIAETLPASQRALFREGAGGGDAARVHVENALARAQDALTFLDPTNAIASLRCPVVVCHGRDDDVIPWGEAVMLHRAVSAHVPSRLYLTGLYAHTGQGTPAPGDILREAANLLGLTRVMANGGRLRDVLGHRTNL